MQFQSWILQSAASGFRNWGISNVKICEIEAKKTKQKQLNVQRALHWICTSRQIFRPLESFASFLPRQQHGWPQDRSVSWRQKAQFLEGYGMNGKGWTGWNLKNTKKIQEVILHLFKNVWNDSKCFFSLTYGAFLSERLESSTPFGAPSFHKLIAGSTKKWQRLKKNFVYRCKSTNAHSPASWRKTSAMYLSAFHSFAIHFQKYTNNMNNMNHYTHTFPHVLQLAIPKHGVFTYILPAKIATQSRKRLCSSKTSCFIPSHTVMSKSILQAPHMFSNLPSLRTHQKQPWSRTSKLESIYIWKYNIRSLPPTMFFCIGQAVSMWGSV